MPDRRLATARRRGRRQGSFAGRTALAAMVGVVRPRGAPVRLFRDHAIPLGAAVSIALLALAVFDAVRGLHQARQQRASLAALRAELAAEEAAFQALRDRGEPVRMLRTSWGPTARVERVRDIDERLEITVLSPREATVRFTCESLRGAAPACFGHALTLAEGLAGTEGEADEWLRGVARPQLGPLPQLALPAPVKLPLPGLTVDREVAFLHLPAGTDRADYRLGEPPDVIAPPPHLQVAEVPGNLWILPGARALRFDLRAPLTIVVRGNVYLGRSIRVTGGAPLTIVALRSSATYRDLDGDGAHRKGEPMLGTGAATVEGDGSLYLGLPRGSPRVTHSVDAHLVATGEIHLLVPVVLHGALVGSHGLTRCRKEATLTLTGRLVADVNRVRIPGFATTGSPRPGRVRRVE